MNIREIAKTKLDRRTKNFIKLNILILAISLLVFVSIKITAEKKFKQQINSLEKLIEEESKKVGGDMRSLKENLHEIKKKYSSWEKSKNKIADIYSLLLRTSKASSKNINLDEIEIIPDDTKVNFLIKAQSKEPQNASSFSKKLSKKRGGFLVMTEIVNIKNSENGKISFILKGQAWSTKNEKQRKQTVGNEEERGKNELMENIETGDESTENEDIEGRNANEDLQ